MNASHKKKSLATDQVKNLELEMSEFSNHREDKIASLEKKLALHRSELKKDGQLVQKLQREVEVFKVEIGKKLYNSTGKSHFLITLCPMFLFFLIVR